MPTMKALNSAAKTGQSRLTVLALIVVCSLLVSAPVHASKDLPYDPAKCRTEASGKLYISLGRYVFAVPSTTVPFIGELNPGGSIGKISPPDPTEQEGCPLNPNQLESYGFGYAHLRTDNAAPGTIVNARPGGLIVQLIRTDISADDWQGEKVEASISDTICQHATQRDVVAPGVTACRYRQEARETRIDDWQSSYISNPESHGTPLRRPFIVNCSGMSYTFGGQCDVAYLTMPHLGITYRFAIRKGTTINLTETIDFDRGIRALIESMRLKNYQWPDGKSGEIERGQQ